MFWLFLTCKSNKQKSFNFRNFTKLFLCNIQSLETVAFETKTRKYGFRDSITGSDINAHCIYYREYWFPHRMFGSDGVSRRGLGLETSDFSSLSLEGLRSCLGLQKYGLVKLLQINVFLVCCICR